MQQLLENIIFELLNSERLKDKYIGMQLAHEFTKKSINEDKRKEKIKEIKKKLYAILLDSIEDNIATTIKNNNAIIKSLTMKIKRNSGWSIGKNGTFYKRQNNITYSLLRNKEGYFVHPRMVYEITKIEEDFYKTYQSELQVIHSALLENDNILNNIDCFIKKDRRPNLIHYIIEFLNNEEKVLEVKKLYK